MGFLHARMQFPWLSAEAGPDAIDRKQSAVQGGDINEIPSQLSSFLLFLTEI